MAYDNKFYCSTSQSIACSWVSKIGIFRLLKIIILESKHFKFYTLI